MGTLWQDFRYGARMLRRRPGFTLVAALALALGIGANTAIFSVINGVVMRPLPYREPAALVRLWASNPERGLPFFAVAAPDFLDWQEQNRVFELMAAYDTEQNYNLTDDAEPEQLLGMRVTADLFPLLGVNPALGRAFSREEDTPGGNTRIAVLSHGLWQRRFGGEQKVIGQTITLDSERYTVIGVMPAGFQLPVGRADVWLPLALNPNVTGRGYGFLRVLARMKSGVMLDQAKREMTTVAARLAQENPGMNAGWGVSIRTLTELIVGPEIRVALWVLLAAVGLVLLIACANIANLLLARAAGRQREMAIRAALGASRWRLIWQLLTESLMLALLGGVGGLLLALWVVDLLVKLGAGSIPRVQEIGVDGAVLAFTFAVSLLTGVLVGILPAWQSSKSDLTTALKDGGSAGAFGPHRLRSMLVVAEISLSLVLLVGAGLMMKSFVQLQRVNPGFNPHNVVALPVTLPAKKYPQPQQAGNFYQALSARLEALPGVQAVGAINIVPLGGGNPSISLAIEGRPLPEQQKTLTANFRLITPGYFHAMEIPVRAGRAFTAQDNAQSEPVVVISDAMARSFWPGEDPLGKHIRIGLVDRGPWLSVIGVVGDVKSTSLEADQGPMFYLPYWQIGRGPLVMVARTATDPSTLIAAMRGQVWAIDKDQPVANIRTMEEVLGQSVAPSRFFMFLMGSFAGVALLLALVGVYGVISYLVTERTREIGVRIALGAQPRDILRLVVGQGLRLVLLGVGMGTLAAYSLGTMVKYFSTSETSKLLYQVSVTDPATFALVALLLAGAALLACYLPARSCLKVDPMVALRYE